MSDTKNCPFCDEEIKALATKCRHCQKALNPDEPKKESANIAKDIEFDIEKDKAHSNALEVLAIITLVAALLATIALLLAASAEGSWTMFAVAIGTIFYGLLIYYLLLAFSGMAVNISAIRQTLNKK